MGKNSCSQYNYVASQWTYLSVVFFVAAVVVVAVVAVLFFATILI